MKLSEYLDFYSVILLGLAGMCFAMYWNYTHPQTIIKYDCSITEINPDYPVQVKEQCRRLNMRKLP